MRPSQHHTTPYVHLTAGGRTLVGSPGQLLPVCAHRCTEADLQTGAIVLENRRFRDVRVDDVLLLSAGASPFALAPVSAVDVFMARGAYNPYIRSHRRRGAPAVAPAPWRT
ncbi:hypothetical protein GPECTOR_23g151 [Gonium pectorale]|uniref:Uncharacterized protein n=1 Tax=Gonium pectorale TaxID=33097 RepID=A0A150GGV6_GONPE|nr:hypothetical protein GPECTOR_23g151 [Gonium pectorale]|eukprot:KXZ49066.1 hypothetical protein GPECTOR_23g151 [Gonium pectorale]